MLSEYLRPLSCMINMGVFKAITTGLITLKAASLIVVKISPVYGVIRPFSVADLFKAVTV